jgi:hypothetical protein
VNWLWTLAQAPAPVLPPWRPFIDPLPASVMRYWFIFLPLLSLLISVVYKAVRIPDLKSYLVQVLYMTTQIVLGMVALAVASYLLVEVYLAAARG